MALETATKITELVDTNPTGSDAVGQADDHLRMLKTVLKADAMGASTVHAATVKASLADADEIPLLDSAASYATKRVAWSTVRADATSVAAGHATDAAASATDAATSATASATSATASATSATASAGSASTASTQATNAATSATAAAGSATSAATSATTATTQASNASTSAATASTQATNAAASATTATTQAGNASTSASSAATSATNAATSASAASTSATNASTAQTAAEAARDATLAAYDSFDDRYLGAKASNPTLDNDGNALVAGALYYNTTAPEMRLYTGAAWVAAYVSGAAYLASANNLSDVGSATTARTNLGLAIGTNVQAYDANTAKTNVEQTFTAQQTPMNGTLTDGATIDWNGDSNGQSVKVTLGGNRTMNAPTNINEYAAYVIRVIQDGTGSRTLAWNSAFKFASATAPTLTTTASAVDVVTFIGGGSNTLICTGVNLDVR